MADTEKIAEMEQAAEVARNELETLGIDAESLSKIAKWWKRHYQVAGHKRLGRILMSSA